METVNEAQRRALAELYERLEARAADTTRERTWWPCRMGCDHCCRHLADPLSITALEWTVLWEGFLQLPRETQAEIRARAAEWEQAGAKQPYTCPLLDANVVIAQALEQHGEEGILWSNQDALEETLKRLAGPSITFFEWFAAHPE
ncbi:YkgJ family cysteine cluster protein [Hyalangium versicolor]|uniref:YkgJ family cysteine cluster protein n=1 Tax=Hyalangium versicolor TaxID=2861190 RepID=UPI001CC98A5A|nr:YkgJ family cysteine cluster protein [Hyalangium versicolor]